MIQKYIIEKTDIHDLLTGQEISLSQGKARAFCVEIVGIITNGDVIKAMFPNGKVIERDEATGYEQMIDDKYSYCSWFDGIWWRTPYKAESEE